MQHVTRNNRMPKVKTVRASKETVNTVQAKTPLELKLEAIVVPSLEIRKIATSIYFGKPTIGKPRPQIV